MDFSDYLKSKKIDPEKFRRHEEVQFLELKNVFDQVHPNSFTAQKLFLINPLRRKYGWNDEQTREIPKSKPMKPQIPKPKI